MAEFKEQDLEWLIIFCAYNNNYYDHDKKDTIDYYTMQEQTKYIRNQIRYTNYNHKVKTVLVEAQIKNTKQENSDEFVINATMSLLHKEEGEWLHAVDKIWRVEDDVDALTNIPCLEKVLLRLKNKYNAKRHIIITIGHGSIVGVNYYIPGLKPKADRVNNNPMEKEFEKKYSSKPSIAKSIQAEVELQNGKKLFFLSNQEISETLQKVFCGPQKIDVLVMYNCLMQNIFTQYELRNTVEWLVAPLSGISIPGFNYKAVINAINERPDTISNEEVATLFIETIRNGNNYRKFKEDIENTWKITAENLNKEQQELIYEKLNDFFHLVNDISQTNSRIIDCLYETGRFLFNYSNYCLPSIRMVDLGVFLAYFKDKIAREYPLFENLNTAIEALQNVIAPQKARPLFEGKNFYTEGGDINYKEHEPLFKNAIANIPLFFPITPFESNLLDFIYQEDAYGDRTGNKAYKIPRLLRDFSYGSVLTKLKNLPD